MTRFAHISDTHLGYCQYHLKAREEDFYEAFKEAVDKIIEEDVDFLIHSGDLVNRYRSHPKPLKIAADQFKRLKNHDIPTYIVPGNHDIARKSGALPVQSVLSDFTYTLMGGGKRIFKVHDDIFIGGVLYLPATYSKVLKKRITRLTEKARNYDTRILILHQGIRRFSEFDYQLTWNDLPWDVFDYIAMGHVHKRIRVETGKGILAYPGSTEMWKRDEMKGYQKHGKGFYVVDLDPTPPKVKTVDLESIRPFRQEEIKKEEMNDTLERIVEEANKQEKRPVIFLTVTGLQGRHKVEYYTRVIEEKLEDVTLKYQVDFDFSEKARKKTRKEKKNRREILSEYFEGEEEAKFAYELLDTLITEDIEAGKEKAENFFQDRYGGEEFGN